jgi:hypothetical protein
VDTGAFAMRLEISSACIGAAVLLLVLLVCYMALLVDGPPSWEPAPCASEPFVAQSYSSIMTRKPWWMREALEGCLNCAGPTNGLMPSIDASAVGGLCCEWCDKSAVLA